MKKCGYQRRKENREKTIEIIVVIVFAVLISCGGLKLSEAGVFGTVTESIE